MAHGGKRVGAGRRTGSKNRATVAAKGTLEELARQYTDLALNTLATIAEKGESETARVAASGHLLDRGYGKPHQSTNVTMNAGDAFIGLLRMVNERRAENGTLATGVDQSPERSAEVRH
jgi:hypothetical protein